MEKNYKAQWRASGLDVSRGNDTRVRHRNRQSIVVLSLTVNKFTCGDFDRRDNRDSEKPIDVCRTRYKPGVIAEISCSKTKN
jgi:hypothetical protein